MESSHLIPRAAERDSKARFGERWPDVVLTRVPRLEEAGALARLVRFHALGPDALAAPLSSLDEILEAGRFKLMRAELFGHEGGLDALLAPRRGNSFHIEVDPEPGGGWRSPPGIRARVCEQRVRFRVCHEIAHSFFYDRTRDVPRRTVLDSRAQERFCDRFASALLVPEEVVAERAVRPGSILDVQRRYHVSLQVAIQAFADVHANAFVALLVATGRSAPVSVQWRSCDSGLPTQWWMARWLQEALQTQSGTADRSAELLWRNERVTTLFRALPRRRQVLVSALPAG